MASRLFARRYATSSLPPLEKTMLPSEYAAMKHAQKSTAFWNKFCMFIVAPALVVTAAYVYNRERAHFAHWTAQEYQPWAHLRKRRSMYPWGDGDKTLFYNDKVNPTPPEDE